jgi:hypothetical protein
VTKQKKCKVCGTEFIQQRTTQQVCDWKCALDLQAEKQEKKRKKEIREQKKKLRTRSEVMRIAQTAFNRFIRQRDLHDPCISCGRHHKGQYHAGHLYTTKARPDLRFNEDNCHKQCSSCNNYLSGNVQAYRVNLTEKIGKERVEALEREGELPKYTIDDLEEIKKIYNHKYRQLL